MKSGTFRAGMAAAVISALAFSTEGLFSVRSFELGVDISTALAIRYAIATAGVVGWLLFARHSHWGRPNHPGTISSRRPSKATRSEWSDLLLLVGAGLLAHAGLPRLLFESFLLIPTWLTLLVFYTFPVMVAVGEHLLGRERLSGQRIVTVLMAFGGVALVAQSQGEVLINPWGIVYALGAAVLNTVFMLVLGPVLQRVRLGTAVAAQFAGGLSVHVLVLMAGGAVVHRLTAALPAWWWLLGLGLITTVISVVMLNLSVRTIGAGRAAIIGTLEPVFVIVWGVTLLGEPITSRQAVGAALVTLGVLGVVSIGSRRSGQPNV